MRALLLGDIIAATRALMAMPDRDPAIEIRRMLDQAHAAHHYQKRKTVPHPDWGNGSLMARANRAVLVAEPFASNIQYLIALQVVIAAVIERKARLECLGGYQSCKSRSTL